jgi:hypothetical protein
MCMECVDAAVKAGTIGLSTISLGWAFLKAKYCLHRDRKCEPPCPCECGKCKRAKSARLRMRKS